eukprot:1687546-Prymnesium_polylepis.1
MSGFEAITDTVRFELDTFDRLVPIDLEQLIRTAQRSQGITQDANTNVRTRAHREMAPGRHKRRSTRARTGPPGGRSTAATSS